MTPTVEMIITAGGFSKRHPGKLFHSIKGIPALIRCVRGFQAFPMGITVVTGHNHEKISALLEPLGVKTVYNPLYATGLAASIRAGVKACERRVQYFGVCNGDKPFIRLETIAQMLDQLSNGTPAILLPTFEALSGHPVFFAEKFRENLLALEGDTGGSQLIEQFPGELTRFPVPDQGIIQDMDRFLGERAQSAANLAGAEQ